MKLPVGGTPVTIAKSAGPMGAVVIDATSVYWIATPVGQTQGMVMKATPK